jgi:XTP/dITP diphosphohydrolase
VTLVRAGDRVVIASTNAGKVIEIRQILSGLGLELLAAGEVGGWPEIHETGTTYRDNALLKGRSVAGLTGIAALADDSGIEVDALGGEPGVYSARFAGPQATDEANNALLIARLRGVPQERRTARYRCVAVVVTPEGREYVGEGTCEGRIAFEPRGSGGFGYDPWFIPEGETRTMADLAPEEKDAISHRGKALRQLAEQLID